MSTFTECEISINLYFVVYNKIPILVLGSLPKSDDLVKLNIISGNPTRVSTLTEQHVRQVKENWFVIISRLTLMADDGYLEVAVSLTQDGYEVKYRSSYPSNLFDPYREEIMGRMHSINQLQF